MTIMLTLPTQMKFCGFTMTLEPPGDFGTRFGSWTFREGVITSTGRASWRSVPTAKGCLYPWDQGPMSRLSLILVVAQSWYPILTGGTCGSMLQDSETLSELASSVNQPSCGPPRMNVKNIGDDVPSDYFTHVIEGGFYGWPVSYIGQHLDNRVAPRPELIAKTTVSNMLLGAHVAPLQFVFYGRHQFSNTYWVELLLPSIASGIGGLRAGTKSSSYRSGQAFPQEHQCHSFLFGICACPGR
jgi:hypothetical protein